MNPDTIPDIFGSSGFSFIENFEYNIEDLQLRRWNIVFIEDYINTDYNAQYGLGSKSTSDLSNSSSVSSLGVYYDLFSKSIPCLTLDSETHSTFDLESIQDGSLGSQAKPNTNDVKPGGFNVGCYNGDNGPRWIAFVLFNFLAMFIVPLQVSLLYCCSKSLF